MTPQIFTLIAIFGSVGSVLLLKWYKRKEEQALKAVEFKIIAAERDLAYVEDGDFYHTYLSQLGLLSGMNNIHITNVTSREYSNYSVRIFDVTAVNKRRNKPQQIFLYGAAIEFEQSFLPKFELTPATHFNGTTFFTRMQRVKNDRMPRYLQHDFFLYYDRYDPPQEVSNLFYGKDALKNHLEHYTFYKMAGSENTLVVYWEGGTSSTHHFVLRTESRIQSIGKVFDRSLDIWQNQNKTDEIKRRKGDGLT